MRVITVLVALLFALTMSSTTVSAQGRGNGQAKKPTAGSQPKVKAGGPKSDAPKAKASTPKPTQETKHAAKAEAQAAKKAAKSSTVTTTPTTVVTETTPTTTSIKNPKLEARLQGMLPAGMTVQDAKLGFRNWGQFVAAVHVSNNLGLPFDQLKSLMTGIPITAPGTTPPATPPTPTMTPMSLGQAIQTLKGTASTTPPLTTTPSPTTTTPTTTTTASAPMTDAKVRAEVKKAEDAARADLRRTRETS
jgi:hypothetical protein